MVSVSEAVGVSVFASMLAVAVFLYLVDRFERVNLSLPYGRTIPYTLTVIGAAVFFLSTQGVLGLLTALASAIVVGIAVDGVQNLRVES